MSTKKSNTIQIFSIIILLSLISLEIVNILNLLGEKLFLRELLTGGDYLRPGPAVSSQDVIIFVIIIILSLNLFFSGKVKTTVIPEQVAVKLVQKAKVAEKKAAEAEKKIAKAEKKVAKAEKKAAEAEKKAEEIEEELDFDDFDDFDEQEAEEEPAEEPAEEPGKNSSKSQSEDIELDSLLEQASESEDVSTRANRLMAQGNLAGALDVWKKATINNGDVSEYWRGLAQVLDLMGESEKSKIAKEHADRLDSKLIAEKTGRKMEDILADLLDDGILNFSAGSDSISTDTQTSVGFDNEDLTLIPGIGNVSAKRLKMKGISTIEQVSKMNDSEIMEIINSKKLDSWSDMAKKILENDK